MCPAMLELRDLCLSMGGRDLVTGAQLRLHPGDKLGLIGRNGAGKTTLLRAICGKADVEGGQILLRPGLALGHMDQHSAVRDEARLWDVARASMTRLARMQRQLDEAQRAVEQSRSGAAERLGEATEAFRLAGGYAADERVGEVLHGLGFGKQDWERPCGSFSGGWQVRIALARLLLSEPTLMLLDEPTNHLDAVARSWLAGFLKRSPHALLLVSHDRHLLQRVCTRMAEIHSRQLLVFKGGLRAWLEVREQRLASQQAAYQSQQQEIQRLERFVTRFRAQANKASQARSRQRRLDRMERLEAPERETQPRYQLPPAPKALGDALELRGASLAWPGDDPVFQGLNFRLEVGSRVALLGPNGCGKSTLLRALAGLLPLSAGRRRIGEGLRVGVFTQDLARDLPAESSALDCGLAAAPSASRERVRSALGALGLSGEAALRPIASLSGGERARVALARFALRPSNALLLDEPTNHLDAVTVGVLARALGEFEGCLLMATHDRYLVETVATHVAHVRQGRVTLHEGVRAQDFEPFVPEREKGRGPGAGAADYATRKRRAREQQRLRRRIAAIQAEIESNEASLEANEAQLFDAANDYRHAAELERQRRELEALGERLYGEWEELEARLGEGEA